MARYRRTFRRSFGKKRNAERIIRAGYSIVNPGEQQVAYTYACTDACTIKSVKLDIGASFSTGVGGPDTRVVAYALVRVEEGYNANLLTYPAMTDDMYNPTAEVLISGILTDPAVEDHKWNMIGRKMKKGDRLALLVYHSGSVGSPAGASFELNFSVLT
jgi:hypothetical protein